MSRFLFATVLVTVFVLGAGLGVLAQARSFSAADFKRLSENSQLAYVVGAAGMVGLADIELTNLLMRGVARCLNSRLSGLTVGDLRAIIGSYVENHPEQRQDSMAPAVLFALSERCQ
jgi:hypothetical protein